MERRLGGVDDVIAPIGGFWAGKQLWEIDEADWQSAFVGLATTHMAIARACLPRLNEAGAYCLIVGDSAGTPVPGSGLVSMEQAAVLMMQQVLGAELKGRQRVFALVLGPVRTRFVEGADPDWVTSGQVGQAAVAASAGAAAGGQQIRLGSQAEFASALARFSGKQGQGELS